MCVCVWVPSPPSLQPLWTSWHSGFKASSFSSTWKYADRYLFFLPAMFRWPHLLSRGDKTISNSIVQKDTSNSVLTWRHLNSFHFSFRSVGGDGFWNKLGGRTVSAGAGEASLLAPSFPARWTSACRSLCCMRWGVFLFPCVLCKALVAPGEIVCLELLMLPPQPKGKPSRPNAPSHLSSSVAACRILN